MTGGRVLRLLGRLASWLRTARLGGLLGFFIDLMDGLLLRIEKLPIAATFEDAQLGGYLRHRGFLEYVDDGMKDESFYRTLILGRIDERTTFVDAGAHIGIYTILACKTARRIVAFEPDPYNLAALRINVARHACRNVEIRGEALADARRRAPFRSFRGTLSSSLAPREVERYRETTAEVVGLDDSLTEADLDDLVVKLDVEGVERLALAGMSSTIRGARKLSLFVEVNPEALAAARSTAEELTADLLASGLECAFIDEETATLIPLNEVTAIGKGNVCCHKLTESNRRATSRG